MAARGKTTIQSLGLTLNSSVSLLSHIVFFQYLASPEFYRDFSVQFQNVQNLERIQNLAKIIIEARIYSVYDPKKYSRTFNLLNSFLAANDSESTNANIALYSSPSIAKAELVPDHSYAEFFDPASEKRTFLLNVLEPGDAIRPFVESLFQMLESEMPDLAIQAFETAINASKPTN